MGSIIASAVVWSLHSIDPDPLVRHRFRTDVLYMSVLVRRCDAAVMTLVRALGLYFGFYVGIFLVAPFVVVFDSWSILPLWAWMLAAVSMDVVRNAVRYVWNGDSIPLVEHTLLRASPVWCDVGPGLRHRNPSRGLRNVRVRSDPLHRRVRFGRTRLR